MHRRQSNFFFGYLLIMALAVCLMIMHATIRQDMNGPLLQETREIAKALTLTDLCLFTEARYTRHPSMADLNTPFQDHPMSFDHFPSGSIMPVPPHLNPRVQK